MMRVLLFVNSSCDYLTTKGNIGYNGGGWIDSIVHEIRKSPDIELGICFPMDGEPFKTLVEDVEYYPIGSHVKSIKDKIIDAVKYSDVRRDEVVWGQYIDKIKRAVDDFKPDVIEIFGSEVYIDLAALAIDNTPKILHIQGLLSLSIYIYYPYGISPVTYYFQDWNLRNIYHRFQVWVNWKRSCHREQQIFKHVSHVIGRTSWDKAGAAILNPDAEYHYGSEILRPIFYEPYSRAIPKKLTIVTTSSSALYKGFEFVLKVADVLKNKMHIDFEWNVFGNVNPRFFEKITGLKHANLNIHLCGVASAEQVREGILNSTLYFQPSYIENSPNSVCEAQLLGVSVIATNVGGTSSLITEGETGILIPAGEPYFAAYKIMELYKNTSLNIEIGEKARVVALDRHNPKKNVENLINIYKNLLKS
ncbi:glycosyltransferase [Prevotella koreensis]|uniref:glycosyltransferase family 4 protein n=1 Tax=Prevotella koreensis TaxID=2490854 RepID=UPI0028EF6816|nr:glycosyltransferase [Prevotella koreensis]